MGEIDRLYEVRDYLESDKSFIKATFLRGLYYGDSWYSLIPKDIFMDNYSMALDRLFDHPSVTIKIACLTEDPDVILGYSILSADFMTIHWVFVKKAWRTQGVAKRLTPRLATTVTHLSALGKLLCFGGTKDGQTINKKLDCVFNPFKL